MSDVPTPEPTPEPAPAPAPAPTPAPDPAPAAGGDPWAGFVYEGRRVWTFWWQGPTDPQLQTPEQQLVWDRGRVGYKAAA